jgi:thiol-disulfide isomerase/thioredoxin
MKKILLSFLIFCTITSSAQKLPDFELVDMNGDTLTSESLKGKHVYINVWETTCQPCLAEIPILNYAVGKTEDIILLSVTADKRSKVGRTLEKRPLNLRAIPDADHLVEALGASRYPSHYFVDTAGNIREFDFPLGISFVGKTKEEAEEKRKAAKKDWNSIMVEQNKDKFCTKLLELKRSK